jgi:hypothetical protein
LAIIIKLIIVCDHSIDQKDREASKAMNKEMVFCLPSLSLINDSTSIHNVESSSLVLSSATEPEVCYIVVLPKYLLDVYISISMTVTSKEFILYISMRRLSL